MELKIKDSEEKGLIDFSLVSVYSREVGKSIELKLIHWFRRQKRDLVFRKNRTPYRVWISEIMLQQTQVITVIPYFERWMKKFPTVEHLAHASEEDVFQCWAGLGYYSRARNILKGARLIVEQSQKKREMIQNDESGEGVRIDPFTMEGSIFFPENREEWLQIPGVGPYTAGAICSTVYHQYEPLVDGNVERVFSRLHGLSRAKCGEKKWKAVHWELAALFMKSVKKKKESASDFNEALMECGATICTAQSPKCSICPIQSECEAFASKKVDQYPGKKPKAETVHLKETVYAMVDSTSQKILLKKDEKWRKGLWDFLIDPPTLNWEKWKHSTFQTKYAVTHHKIERTTHLIIVEDSKKIKLKDHQKWIQLNSPEVPLGAPAKKGIQLILERLE